MYEVCSRKPFISVEGGTGRVPLEKFWSEIAASKFTICPKGNGEDSHRIWEALYLGSIPVVENTVALRYFSELPLLYVEDFESITESLEFQTPKRSYCRLPSLETGSAKGVGFDQPPGDR